MIIVKELYRELPIDIYVFVKCKYFIKWNDGVLPGGRFFFGVRPVIVKVSAQIDN